MINMNSFRPSLNSYATIKFYVPLHNLKKKYINLIKYNYLILCINFFYFAIYSSIFFRFKTSDDSFGL